MLKWVILATTLFSIWLVIVFYLDKLTIGKSTKMYDPGETLWSTGLCRFLCLEILVLAIQPYPGLDGTVQYFVPNEAGEWTEEHHYSLDGILSLPMLLRCYLFFRGLHYIKGDESGAETRVMVSLLVQGHSGLAVLTCCSLA